MEERKRRQKELEEKKQQVKKLEKKLKDKQYKYAIPEEIYSDVKCLLHELRFNKRLPGRDALKETLMFLKTCKSKGYPCELCYELALKVALHKVENRQFDMEDGRREIIRTVEDVKQVMSDSLEAAGDISTVEEFIYSHL